MAISIAQSSADPSAHGLYLAHSREIFRPIEPGSDPFLCERYAAQTSTYIFRQWSAALCSPSAGDVSAVSFLAPDIDFVPLGQFTHEPLRTTGPIQVDAIEFHELPAPTAVHLS